MDNRIYHLSAVVDLDDDVDDIFRDLDQVRVMTEKKVSKAQKSRTNDDETTLPVKKKQKVAKSLVC